MRSYRRDGSKAFAALPLMRRKRRYGGDATRDFRGDVLYGDVLQLYGDERMQRVFAYRSFIDAAAPAGRQGLHGRPSVAGHPIAPANLPSVGRGCLIFQKATRIKQRRGRRIMVIPKLPKLEPWVRFPSPAPL